MIRRMEARISSIDGSCDWSFASLIQQKPGAYPLFPNMQALDLAGHNACCRHNILFVARNNLLNAPRRYFTETISVQAGDQPADLLNFAARPFVTNAFVIRFRVIARGIQVHRIRRQPTNG